MTDTPEFVSIGEDAAIAIGNTKWWVGLPEAEVAKRQASTAELLMPFDEFHRCVEVALGRPVFTHEFALNLDGIRRELFQGAPPPSMEDILGMLPADKVTVLASPL